MEKREFGIIPFISFVSFPLLLGTIVGLLTRDSVSIYGVINTPPFAPPGILFPIVWGLLYSLMGASLYLVYLNHGSRKSYVLFTVQLALNLLWPILFFSLQAFTAAFVVLVFLWIFILLMILSFARDWPIAAYFQIPYILWVTFAGILNLWIAVAN